MGSGMFVSPCHAPGQGYLRLPEGSYGRRNRQAISARETRVAARLRAVEQAYRIATEHDTAPKPKEPIWTRRSPELQPDRQIDLEAEP
jgi:ribulose bisphosphate carboxylase small subunit